MKAVCGILAALLLVSCSSGSLFEQPEVGTKKRPLSMYFVPSVDAQEIAQKSKSMEKFVSDYISKGLTGETGNFYVETAVPASYIAVVEAFGTQRADFAAFTTFAYVLARDIKGYPVEPIFTIARGPDGAEMTYKGQILARADSNIKTLQDLSGKTFAYTDPSSTSGYILPSQILAREGVKLREHVFAKKHDNVVTMIYQGQVDAGATYYSPPEMVEKEGGEKVSEIRDARMRVVAQYPDVEEKIKIIGFTAEVPNEPWVVRTNLYPDNPEKSQQVIQLLKEAIQAYIKTPEGRDTLWTIATATTLIPATADVYTEVSELIRSSGTDLQSLLEKRK